MDAHTSTMGIHDDIVQNSMKFYIHVQVDAQGRIVVNFCLCIGIHARCMTTHK